MRTRKPKRRCLFSCLLMLCCISFCSPGCPPHEITVSGEVSCEECESGKLTVTVSDCNLNTIAETTLAGCGTYSFLISPAYIGEKLLAVAHCDEDNDDGYSIGDRTGGGVWFELQATNEVNIDVNQEFTATIEGAVSCAPYTDGLIRILAFDGPFDQASPPSYIGGSLRPVNINENGSYKVLLTDTSLGSYVRFLNGNHIVPENWVEESTSSHMPLYGYQWWVLPDAMTKDHPQANGIFSAQGTGGQRSMIIPTINMVIVSTAENFAGNEGAVFDMLFEYILPAVKDKNSLG